MSIHGEIKKQIKERKFDRQERENDYIFYN